MSAISHTEDHPNTPTMGSSDLLKKRFKRLTVEIPHDLHLQLRKAAAAEDIYMRDVVRKAIDEYMKNHGHRSR